MGALGSGQNKLTFAPQETSTLRRIPVLRASTRSMVPAVTQATSNSGRAAQPAAALCAHLQHTREHIHGYVYIYMIDEWRKEGPS
jgi:hypothetical protein